MKKKDEKKKSLAPRVMSVKRSLPVVFTDEELQNIGLALAAKHQEIGKIEVDKKVSADQFKRRIENAVGEAARLAQNRIDGFENRYVDCTETFDFDKGVVRVVRMDTGEIVEERVMRDSERQLAIPAFEQEGDAPTEQPAEEPTATTEPATAVAQ